MGTEYTLVRHNGLILIEDMNDDSCVYFVVNGPHGTHEIEIPIAVWEAMRRYCPDYGQKAKDMTDEQIEAEVRRRVSERLQACGNDRDGLSALCGCGGNYSIGVASQPEEEQVKRGIESYKESREKARKIQAEADAICKGESP